MLSQKTLGTLALLAVLLGAASWMTSRSRNATVPDGGFSDLLPADIDPGAIETLRAYLGNAEDQPLELARSGDGWIVNSRWGWPAKETQIDRVLTDLGKLKGERRSSSDDVLADFQIDDEQGLHVVGAGAGGSEMFHLVAGKSATPTGTFVRNHGSSDVYLTTSSLRTSFGVWGDDPQPPDPKRWIELRVFQADRNEIDQVVLRDGTNELVLAKRFATVEPPKVETPEGETPEGEAISEEAATEPGIDRTNWTWTANGDADVDKNKADSVLGVLCSLYATDVTDPALRDTYGLDEPSRVAELTFADGRTERVVFGAKTEDEKKVYFAVGDGKPAEINTSTVDRIFQDRSELRPTEG